MHAGRPKTVRTTLMIAAVLLGLLVFPAQGQVRGDFNGDGYSDLAVGAPNESIGTIHGAGAVSVIYGFPRAGLRGVDDQVWHQDTPGILGFAEANDAFGFSLASGDFNGDGYSDLAIGAVGEGISAILNAGQVNVIYGSVDGLTDVGNQVFHQNSDGVEETAETGDNFGFTLAAGDFNGDGYDELAIGAPGEGIPGLTPRVNGLGIHQIDDFGVPIFDPVQAHRAGAVHVLSGTAAGLSAEGDQLWHQEAQFFDLISRFTGIGGVAWDGDQFGAALAVGDYNGDSFEDLAIGVRGEGLEALFINNVVVSVVNDLPIGAGAIHVLFSDWSGLAAAGSQFLHQNVLGPQNFGGTQAIAEAGDAFGFSLTSGDFNGDTFDDLAVGVALESLVEIPRIGAVHVIYGFHEGLILKGNVLLHQGIDGVLGNAMDEEQFGYSLAAGDFDGDHYDDLAVGVPLDNIGPWHGAGGVNVFYGRQEGLTVRGNQRWHQGIAGVGESPGMWEQFGSSLAVGDFDGDGFYDLAVGVFNETVGNQNGAGAINVIFGRFAAGLVVGRNQVWHQSKPVLIGRSESVDGFGFSLASTY